jgi:hypothetical protein
MVRVTKESDGEKKSLHSLGISVFINGSSGQLVHVSEPAISMTP